MNKFGTNQKISIGYTLLGMLLTFGLTLGGKVSGEQWCGFLPLYLAAALGLTLGSSAAIKRAQAAATKTSDTDVVS